MPFRLICGPVHSGKTDWIIRECTAHIMSGEPFTLLLPTNRRVEEALAVLLKGAGRQALLNPCVFTLMDFARRLSPPREGEQELSFSEKMSLLRLLLALMNKEGRLSELRNALEAEGSLRHLAVLITELKEGDVGAGELKAAVSRSFSHPPLGDEIAEVFSRYGEDLHSRKLRDREDLFRGAVEALKNGGAPELGALYVDGFYDFNPLQLSLLRAALKRAPVGAITLLYSEDDPELFGPARAIFESLAQEAEEVLFLEGKEGSLSTSGFTLRGGVSLEVLPFRDPATEAQGVAARAKELILREGYSPQEVSVVLRELGGRGAELEEACMSFGLPLRAQEGRPLLESPFVRTLLRLLSTAERRFPVDELSSLLGSSYIPFLKRRGVDAASATRELSLIGGSSGRGSILRRLRFRLERLKRNGKAKSSHLLVERAEPEEQRREVLSAIDALESFFEIMDLLPAQASVEDYAWVLPRIMASLGMGEAVRSEEREELRIRDLAAWEALTHALERLRETHRSLSGDAPISLRSFISELRALCREVRFPSFESRDEGLSLLDVNNVRGLSFKVVLICGASEKEFPLPPRENPFFRDDELRRLNRALGRRALKDKRERTEEERLLFYLAATRPTEKLIVSFPVQDAEGHEVLPSPYLAELVGEERLKEVAGASLGPGTMEPPPYEKVFRKEELLLRAVRDVSSGEMLGVEGGELGELRSGLALLKRIAATPLEQALHGARVETLRRGGRPSGYDGWVTDLKLLSLLKVKLGPPLRLSPTALEEFAACPFRYLSCHLLGLEPEEAEGEELLPKDRGGLYHRILHRFFETLLQETEGALDGARKALAFSIMERDAEALFRQQEALFSEERPLWPFERKEMERNLEELIAHEVELQAKQGGCPRYFEVSFGREDAGPGPSTREPLKVPLQDPGWEVHLRGTIDRIDIIPPPEGPSFRIVDYKSGSSADTMKEVREGLSFQLPLYLMAAEELILPEYSSLEAFYLMVTSRRKEGVIKAGEGEEWRELRGKVRKWVSQYGEEVLSGRFPSTPRNRRRCPRGCPYRAICRFKGFTFEEREEDEGS